MKPYGSGSDIIPLSYEGVFLLAILVKDEPMAPAGTSPFHVRSWEDTGIVDLYWLQTPTQDYSFTRLL